MDEKQDQNYLIQLFKDHGYFVINNSAYSHLPGLPDLLIMKKKTFHLIELKVLKKETRKCFSENTNSFLFRFFKL